MAKGDAADFRTSQVWKQPSSLSFAEPFRAYGGVVCPVLVGFSLAAIIALQTAPGMIPAAPLATAAFAISVVVLIMCMQFAGTALRFTAPPSAHLDWAPEARFDVGVLEQRRKLQGADLKVAMIYNTRVGRTYNGGLIAFLLGCLCISIPAHVSALGLIAPAVFVGALVLEVVWILWSPAWLVPTSDSVDPELNPLDDVSLRSVMDAGSIPDK